MYEESKSRRTRPGHMRTSAQPTRESAPIDVAKSMATASGNLMNINDRLARIVSVLSSIDESLKKMAEVLQDWRGRP